MIERAAERKGWTKRGTRPIFRIKKYSEREREGMGRGRKK